MSRKQRNKDASNTTVLNEIHDVEVKLQEVSINYKKLSSREFREKQEEEKPATQEKREQANAEGELNGNANDEATGENYEAAGGNDAAGGGNKAEKAVKKENKKGPQFPNYLQVTCKYQFSSETVMLCFWTTHDWSLMSLTGNYDFTKQALGDHDFQEIDGDDFTFNMRGAIPNQGAKIKQFRLDLKKIDRNVLMHRFNIKIMYLYLDDLDMQVYDNSYAIFVPYFQSITKLQFKFLGYYHADEGITNLYNNKFKMDSGLSLTDKQLLFELDQYQKNKLSHQNLGNTIKMIKYALNIEDLSSQDELKEFTMKNVRMHAIMNTYSFQVREDKLPPNYMEMSLCIVPMSRYVEGKINYESDCIFTQIEKFEHGQIFFEKKTSPGREVDARREIDLQRNYCVRFVPNRITYRACFQALDMISQHLLQRFFDDFEDEPVNCERKESQEAFNNFEWFNEQIEKNEEQKSAIENIVNCTAFPFPYIVFGPPGTGKTSMIVEAIAQILKMKPKSRIMVTAQSNSACDEVGVRLLKYISQNKIFRFYSPSLLNPKNGDTSDALRRISNLRNNKNEYPTREEFGHFNVMIVTLMSCSRLVQLNGDGMNRIFDYIFVDECAAAMEPEAFVPIMGLGTAFQEITTNLVFLGDHKQLGPVISSDVASRLGLGLSLMERAMSKPRYSMNADKSFNKKYVTQLLDNYRSHPAILQFSNILFYEGKLRAKVDEPDRSFGTLWNMLVNNRFPVLFHCSKEPSKIIKGGTSSYNQKEIDLVLFYVKMFMRIGINGKEVKPEDIGIVSPYKAQLSKFAQALRADHWLKRVEIGTAEYYQGREKKIIIISTVKSRDGVGFLKSEKRLNVCITRAKSLLILVGNGDTLQQNSLWNSFLHFCKANNACCGDEFMLQRLTDEERRLQERLNQFSENLEANPDIDTTEALTQDEKLKALLDRLEKLKELTKAM